MFEVEGEKNQNAHIQVKKRKCYWEQILKHDFDLVFFEKSVSIFNWEEQDKDAGMRFEINW